MDRSNLRSLQHIPLTTAAATVRIRLVGVPPDPRNVEVMWAALDDTAHALALLASIYVADDDGLPRPLKHMELLDGQFLRGAQVFKTKAGKEMRGLTIRRSDMEYAISILKSMDKSQEASRPRT
jgi:hypothetical protein